MKPKTNKEWYEFGKETGKEVYKARLLKYLKTVHYTAFFAASNIKKRDEVKTNQMKNWKEMHLRIIKGFK